MLQHRISFQKKIFIERCQVLVENISGIEISVEGEKKLGS